MPVALVVVSSIAAVSGCESLEDIGCTGGRGGGIYCPSARADPRDRDARIHFSVDPVPVVVGGSSSTIATFEVLEDDAAPPQQVFTEWNDTQAAAWGVTITPDSIEFDASLTPVTILVMGSTSAQLPDVRVDWQCLDEDLICGSAFDFE